MNVTALNRDILSAAIQKTDEQYGTHQYALLTPLGCFQIGCKEDAGNYIGVSTPLPILLPSRAVLELIRYYDDSFSERHRLKKELLTGMELGGMDFTEWYLRKHYWK